MRPPRVAHRDGRPQHIRAIDGHGRRAGSVRLVARATGYGLGFTVDGDRRGAPALTAGLEVAPRQGDLHLRLVCRVAHGAVHDGGRVRVLQGCIRGCRRTVRGRRFALVVARPHGHRVVLPIRQPADDAGGHAGRLAVARRAVRGRRSRDVAGDRRAVVLSRRGPRGGDRRVPGRQLGVPGRPGAPEIVMVFEAVERSDSPSLLTATTVKE